MLFYAVKNVIINNISKNEVLSIIYTELRIYYGKSKKYKRKR